MRTHTMVAALTLATTLALATPAQAKHVRFLGAHPISAKLGGGYCYIDAPHLHAYAPDRAALYQEVGDQYVFTGDPVPFGYDGPKHTFYGQHPIVTATGEPVYCLIQGPHSHAFEPPEGPAFKVKGDVAFYIGPPLPAKPARVKLVNAEYRPYVDLRPTVTVEPPPEWQADVVVDAPSVQVAAPSLQVVAPRPRVEVEVSAPGVVFAPPPPVVFVPPSPHVVIGAPAPHVIISAPAPHVIIGAPAPHVIIGAPAPRMVVGGSVRYEVRHDNGRHEGWHKHGR